MKLNPILQTQLKQAVARKAVELVEEGMLIGLGTGSTTSFFIEALGARCQEGLKIKAVCSSERSYALAQKSGIPLISFEEVCTLDLTVDSADEVTQKGEMIKGGGGALTREKIVASASQQVIIILDESKLVSQLGAFGLPVEILPFGVQSTLTRLKKLGYEGALRKQGEHFYQTDNGNLILDLNVPEKYADVKAHHLKLVEQAGVIETGLFYDLPVKVLIGYETGDVKWMNT